MTKPVSREELKRKLSSKNEECRKLRKENKRLKASLDVQRERTAAALCAIAAPVPLAPYVLAPDTLCFADANGVIHVTVPRVGAARAYP